MGRGWKRARKLSTAPVPYPTAVFQSIETEPYRKELRWHQRKCASHPDLDSLDRSAPAEMAASPLEGELVIVQSGIDVEAKSVHLPRVDQVASQSNRNTAAAAGCRATHVAHELIGTGCRTLKGKPLLEDKRIHHISPAASTAARMLRDCLGPQCMNV